MAVLAFILLCFPFISLAKIEADQVLQDTSADILEQYEKEFQKVLLEGGISKNPDLDTAADDLNEVLENEEEMSDGEIMLEAIAMIKELKNKPDLIVPILKETGFISDDMIKVAQSFGMTSMLTKTILTTFDAYTDIMEILTKSELGIDILTLGMSYLWDPVDEEKGAMAETMWNKFIEGLDQEHVLEKSADTLVYVLVSNALWIQDLAKNDMQLAVANAFFISQDLPTIRSNDMKNSLFNFVDKYVKKNFPSWNIDLEPYKEDMLEYIDLVQREYFTADFAQLPDEDQKAQISQFAHENIVEPLKLVWQIRNFIFIQKQSKCATSLLCHLNAHMKSRGLIKAQVTKAFSFFATWTWNFGSGQQVLDRLKMDTAIMEGVNGQPMECYQKYDVQSASRCHLLPFQQSLKRNVKHVEL